MLNTRLCKPLQHPCQLLLRPHTHLQRCMQGPRACAADQTARLQARAAAASSALSGASWRAWFSNTCHVSTAAHARADTCMNTAAPPNELRYDASTSSVTASGSSRDTPGSPATTLALHAGGSMQAAAVGVSGFARGSGQLAGKAAACSLRSPAQRLVCLSSTPPAAAAPLAAACCWLLLLLTAARCQAGPAAPHAAAAAAAAAGLARAPSRQTPGEQQAHSLAALRQSDASSHSPQCMCRQPAHRHAVN